MLLFELLGIDAAPGRTKHHRTGKPAGRPTEFKVRPRPRKNLWFNDDRLWMNDLKMTRNNDFEVIPSEDEEQVVACNRDRTVAYGKWDKKKGRGITYKDPRPIHTAVHPTSFQGANYKPVKRSK